MTQFMRDPAEKSPADNIISDPSLLSSFVDSLIFRIDNKYYDLTSFSDTHPGGKDILIWAKRKAWDHTQMFSIHHVNYLKASSIMNKFRIKNEEVIDKIEHLIALEVPQRFPKQLPHSSSKYYPKYLKGSGIKPEYNLFTQSDLDRELATNPILTTDYQLSDLYMADCTFELPKKGSFYWELREEVYKYFKKNKIDYYPTKMYMILFWIVAVLCFVFQFMQYWYKSYWLALFTGFTYLFLGGYGHQFIHNPEHFGQYRYLCLDWIGLYSYTYMVDHIAVHHIYTNTIPDNHFEGTDPFVFVNPLIPRNLFRKVFNWIIATCTVVFGIYGNYGANVALMITKKEPFYWHIFIFPFTYIFMCLIVQDVLLGISLCMVATVTCSVWYFTIALMNHNQEENWDMEQVKKTAKIGWAEMQLVTSSDIGYNYGFIGSMLCLWLNYHTVHHLLPTVDMSHHREAQNILLKVSKKHGIPYYYKSFWEMYWNMLETFSIPRAIQVMMERD